MAVWPAGVPGRAAGSARAVTVAEWLMSCGLGLTTLDSTGPTQDIIHLYWDSWTSVQRGYRQMSSDLSSCVRPNHIRKSSLGVRFQAVVAAAIFFYTGPPGS